MRRLTVPAICLGLSATLFAPPNFAGYPLDWKPVSPEDLQLQKARIDPAADAECLFWEMAVEDQFASGQATTTYTHYIRIKIFSDAGVKKFGTVDLEYRGKERIADVTGRTVEPDGSVVELKKDAIFNRIVEKRRREKTRATSFAMPGVKPGAIIEYRYRVFLDGQLSNYVPLRAQLDVPVERIVYHIKPFTSPLLPYQMKYLGYNVDVPPFITEPNGFATTHLENVPAFTREDDAPPDLEIQPWILIYYSPDVKEDVDHFWKTRGRDLHKNVSLVVKVNSDVKQIATEVTSGAKSDDDKLRALYLYCRKHIKNINGPEATDADRQAFKLNHNTADTLKRGVGTGRDIQLAFLALATAAGFDARVAYLMDRHFMYFRKQAMIPWLPVEDIAVQVGGKWRLYDPANNIVEPGHVRWQEEGVAALIEDAKDPEFFAVPVSPAEQSKATQAGHMTLSQEGTLEGDLRETLTGHLAEEWRGEFLEHSQQEREKIFTNELNRRFPGAVVSDLKLSDPADIEAPVSISYHLKMDGFATRTGKRLFVTPAVFQFNEPARYPSAQRKYDVVFRYPWTEVEDVSISVPDGFIIDHPDIPHPITFGAVGSWSAKLLVLNNRFLYHREFTFGKDGGIMIAQKSYPVLKKIFDEVHDNDGQVLTLKEKSMVAEAK